MIWNIDADGGSYLYGWLVSENRAREPVFTVVVDGRIRYRIPANFERPDLKEVGWHESGLCGFRVDRENCPDIMPDTSLEVFEEDTNTLIYRRAPPAEKPVRIFHLETQTFPIYAFDANLSPFVRLKYDHAELIGEETLNSIIKIGWCESVLVSGSIAYRRYAPFLRELGYHRSILLADPVRELAGRLIQIQMLARHAGRGRKDGASSWKQMGQGSLIDAFAGVDLRKPSAIASGFRKLSDEAFFSLADPLTRKLVGQTLQDPVQDHHVAAALDTLAEFDMIGFDMELGRFVDHFEALLDGAKLSRVRQDDPPDLAAVVAAVTACRPVRELIRLDVPVFDLARVAASKAATAGSAGALAS